MTKILVNCPVCGKLRWAKAKKDKVTGEVYVDILDQYCQTCRNKISQRSQKRKTRIRRIPELTREQKTQLIKGELVRAEMERRRKDKK